MRLYTKPKEAFREVERDLFEMGIHVHPETMQDKVVKDNPDYDTLELQGYGFQIAGWQHNDAEEADAVKYVLNKDDNANGEVNQVLRYIVAEFQDRTTGIAMNPGNAWITRQTVWREFMHNGKFAYTYSERIAPQLDRILQELRERPNTRQAIINIHSNISPAAGDGSTVPVAKVNVVKESADWYNMGGNGRIPCSLYYQILRRNDAVDLVYAMRSCDFLTHFPVDIMIALRLQNWFAQHLQSRVGRFTYFTGSLHAYHKDMQQRGIF